MTCLWGLCPAGRTQGSSLVCRETFKTTSCRHTACLIAINTGPGTSHSLGCRTVDVP